MRRRVLVWGLLVGALALAVGPESLTLPKPNTTGGMPLMQALAERKSAREYSAQTLSPQILSNLLWAGFGVNRPDGRRTAPSASNRQLIDIYAVTADGVYLYEAKTHRLELVVSGNFRAATGTQTFAGEAPLNLVFVADYAKMVKSSDTDRSFYAAADTGFISQNVYLYCASEGLATVVRASVNREALAKAMQLRPDQRVVLTQTVGYPRRTD